MSNTIKPTMPSVRCTQQEFRYIHSSCTDVARTWARFGWVPPSKERAHVQ